MQYPTRAAFARTIETWVRMWLDGQMGDKEFPARLAAIARTPVKLDVATAEREGWRD